MSSPSLDDILAAVDNWFAEEVQRAPLSYHTECYNQMYTARASLKNRLVVVITGEPLAPPTPPAEEPGAGEPGSNQAEAPETASNKGKDSSQSKPGK